MYIYRVWILNCSIVSIFLKLSNIVKISWCKRFSNICISIIRYLRNRLIFIIDFHSFAKINKLFFNIPCSSHRSNLYKVFHAPLGRKICFLPLVINVKKSYLISSRPNKVFMSIIRMQNLIFRSIKYRVTYRKHWTNSQNLINTFILFRHYYTFWKLWIKRKFCHSSSHFC